MMLRRRGRGRGPCRRLRR